MTQFNVSEAKEQKVIGKADKIQKILKKEIGRSACKTKRVHRTTYQRQTSMGTPCQRSS